MSDTEETSARSALKDLLINNPLATASNEPETPPDEITTNSIENSSRVINEKPDDFDNEAIQEQMNDLIHDLQSDSITPDDQTLSSQKVLTTGRLNDPEDNTSTPAIADTTSETIPQAPRRSISESALNKNSNSTEPLSTLPVQQDENSTEEETWMQRTFKDKEQTSPLPASSRKQSAASKNSARGEEKPNNDADREVPSTSRRSSTTKSPVNQPRSPTPSDSQQNEKPKSRVSSALRPASTTKSHTDDNTFSSTTEQSKLIKTGEQLQIPTDDLDSKLINSPPPSPVTKDLPATNPLLTNNSRPASTLSREKVLDGDVISAKSQASRRSSKDSETKQRQSPSQPRSGQHSRKNSTDRTILSPLKINSAKSQEKIETRPPATDSENEQVKNSKSSSRSITPTNENQTNRWAEQAFIPPVDHDTHQSRPQSPSVEQIAERNQLSSSSKKRSNAEQPKPPRRTNSSGSSTRIRLVDEKSLDSTSGNNTETEQSQPRRTKPKKKAEEETNADRRSGNQQQQESTSRKPSKTSQSMTEHSPAIRRRIHPKEQTSAATPDTEPETDVSNVRHSVKKSKKTEQSPRENERQTVSDTEQVRGEKAKKPRRPKRISRTTQTYECVFRRMEHDQHEELRPKADTEKNIQTRKSQLRPATRSPKKHYPVYISADEFKLEEILPKHPTSRTPTQTSSSQPNKLLILRPTLPIQHAESSNVQRISLHYNIDLVSKETKSTTSTPDLRSKTPASAKPAEEKGNLPNIRSTISTVNAPTHKFNPRDKTGPNRKEEKHQPRKTGGAV